MIIGVPKEIKNQESRVGLLPSAAYQLVKKGHTVLVETAAGAGAGYADAEYERAGARLCADRRQVFAEADLIVKVKEPQPDEYPLLRRDQILFTYLHLAANRDLTTALLESGVTGIAYETISVNRHLPLLEPMSEIAGRMSAIVGAYYLGRPRGGSGMLVSGVPGVLPAKVLVIGGGTAGVNAARMATGMGADVTILEVDVERMHFLDISLHTAHTLYSSEQALLDQLPRVDLLIGAVLVPGAKAPKLITRDMLRQMRPGSVFVDIAIDQGGCSETSRATTHDDPVYVEEDVNHYCVANMPAAYCRTATQALTNVTFKYIETIATHGLSGALKLHPELSGGLNTQGGRLTCEAVATAHGIPHEPAQA
jgi:alanine dehydrogenase